MIEFQSVSKRYRTWLGASHSALADASFKVSRGEAIGFVGENGAGKSTAIKILLGLLRPSMGVVKLRGLDPRSPAARRSVGYVPETPSLHDNLTPREIVSFSAQYRDFVGAPGFSIGDVVARLGLEKAAGRRVRSLSKGLAQRTTVAQAMVGRPDLLILDEPLSGLDPSGRADVVEFLAEYKASGGTIFFSSHVLHDVERLADRVLFIHHGTIFENVDIQEFFGAAQTYSIRYAARQPIAGSSADRAGVYSITVPSECLVANIGEILGGGGRVLEVKPATSLEQKFLEMIRQ